MEYKGQGALEYLLLIGGAILVEVIVIALIVGLGGGSGEEAKKSAIDASCARYSNSVAECNAQSVNYNNACYSCVYDDITLNRCIWDDSASTGAPNPQGVC